MHEQQFNCMKGGHSHFVKGCVWKTDGEFVATSIEHNATFAPTQLAAHALQYKDRDKHIPCMRMFRAGWLTPLGQPAAWGLVQLLVARPAPCTTPGQATRCVEFWSIHPRAHSTVFKGEMSKGSQCYNMIEMTITNLTPDTPKTYSRSKLPSYSCDVDNISQAHSCLTRVEMSHIHVGTGSHYLTSPQLRASQARFLLLGIG